MYYTLKTTLENVEQISRRLQPVIEDVRIFTDKISRDPRQLGVAGALQARPVGLEQSKSCSRLERHRPVSHALVPFAGGELVDATHSITQELIDHEIHQDARCGQRLCLCRLLCATFPD